MGLAYEEEYVPLVFCNCCHKCHRHCYKCCSGVNCNPFSTSPREVHRYYQQRQWQGEWHHRKSRASLLYLYALLMLPSGHPWKAAFLQGRSYFLFILILQTFNRFSGPENGRFHLYLSLDLIFYPFLPHVIVKFWAQYGVWFNWAIYQS